MEWAILNSMTHSNTYSSSLVLRLCVWVCVFRQTTKCSYGMTRWCFSASDSYERNNHFNQINDHYDDDEPNMHQNKWMYVPLNKTSGKHYAMTYDPNKWFIFSFINQIFILLWNVKWECILCCNLAMIWLSIFRYD